MSKHYDDTNKVDDLAVPQPEGAAQDEPSLDIFDVMLEELDHPENFDTAEKQLQWIDKKLELLGREMAKWQRIQRRGTEANGTTD